MAPGSSRSSRPATISCVPARVRPPRELDRLADGKGAVERRPLREEADLGEHRRLAKGVAAEHGERALGRGEQARGEREQRRLARGVRPGEPDDLAFGNGKRAAPQPPVTMEALAKVPRVEREPHAAEARLAWRKVVAMSARMLSSSRPAWIAARQPELELGTEGIVVPQRGRRERARDERPAPLARDDEPVALEQAIGLGDRVRIDREIGDHLAHRRQLVTDVDRPEPERLLHLLDDLEVGCDAGGRVEVELDHACIVPPSR